MSKYVWCNEKFYIWIKDQINLLKVEGLTSVGTDTVTKVLVERILIPNKIKLTEILRPHIKIKGGVKELCSEF